MERVLTAIMVLDLAGYSHLMSVDEFSTHAAFRDVRAQILESRITEHSGIVVKLTGDGLLARFHSVVNAAKCAVDIQRDMMDRNGQLPPAKHLLFRIGINVGEAFIETDDVYGDSVNVAARLEQLAEPGGVYLSEAAFQYLKTRTAFRFEHIGRKHLKNIGQPVSVYRVVIAPTGSGGAAGAIPSKKKTASLLLAAMLCVAILAVGSHFLRPALEAPGFGSGGPALPGKPIIAVLPFDDMSEQADNTFFADGVTEDIITDLSKLSGTQVISRNSTFTYKGMAVRPQSVHRDLGARYIVEGSIRRNRDGRSIRINAQLIDAVNGVHIWAERYDASLADLFVVQDKVTSAIVKSLAIQVSDAEQRRLALQDTESIAAYEAFQKGWQHFQKNTPEDLATALAQFQLATKLDPSYGRAYAATGHAYLKSWAWGWEASVGETYLTAPKRAREFLDLAMKTQPSAIAHQLAAEIATYERDFEAALTEAEQAVSMAPSEINGLIGMAEALIFSGRPADALRYVRTARLLDPLNPAYADYVLGLIYFGEDKFKESIPFFERALSANPDDFAPAAPLTAAQAHLGNELAMQHALGTYLKGWPEASIQEFREYWPYRDPADEARLLDGLRKAGMPER